MLSILRSTAFTTLVIIIFPTDPTRIGWHDFGFKRRVYNSTHQLLLDLCTSLDTAAGD